MARVGGINIPDNKHIDVSLTHIYGIGRKTAQNICDKLSIKYTKKVSELSEDQLDKIRDELNSARKLFKENNWPTIDVTRKSVEETAASIIKIHEIYSNNVK